MVLRAAAIDETLALLGHFLGVLFSHRAAQQVGLAERVARKHAGGELDLLLINDDPVRLGADFFQKRVEVFDFFQALLALDIVVDELHRARAVERADGDDVLDRVDIEAFAAIRDAGAFHLEDAQGFAAVVDVERGLVVLRDGVEIKIRRVDFDEPHGLLHDREGLEAEEVHLEHAEVGEWTHGVLGDDFVLLAAAKRDELIERAVANDDARSMDAGVAAQALEDGGVVPELADGGLVVDRGLEFGVFGAGRVEVDVQLVRDHFGEPVAIAVAPTHHAGDIAHDALRAEGAEGDDLRHGALAVFLPDILDHLTAPLHAEIDIDIGRAHAFGIEEALEDQAEAERVDIGDTEHIRDDRTSRRATPRADGDSLLLRVVDEIPDDEKITGEAGFLDHREFVIEALVQLRLGIHARAVAVAKPVAAEVAQVLLAGAGVGRIEARVFWNAELHFEITPLGDA